MMDLGLDIRTLAVMVAVTVGIAALVLGLLYRLHTALPGPREWAVGTRDGARLRCARRADGAVSIAVSDDGEGIDPADRPHIFEKFSRSSRTQRRPGAGLGLYLVRKVVDLHGGRIEVESGRDGGSTFKIVLPSPTSAPLPPSTAT